MSNFTIKVLQNPNTENLINIPYCGIRSNEKFVLIFNINHTYIGLLVVVSWGNERVDEKIKKITVGKQTIIHYITKLVTIFEHKKLLLVYGTIID